MALAHHGLAILSNGAGRWNFLSKARGLYCLAYKNLRDEQGQGCMDPLLLPLLAHAILNNLAQCYASLDDEKNSVACFELLLRSIILFQLDQKKTFNFGGRDDCSFNDPSTTCFLRNTLFLILKDPGFAPAA
ncbi:hypothetical protein IV203_018868 [Nitzschia inconspicua]|uniref:Uncharacterized protein n=1 Tax=Nitzschia inconspicua TaxID=303405 RepID=A0A9K3M2D8_9STRA|nr:hypothetical protein IV203_018868 [Nitzschia inconspicua]